MIVGIIRFVTLVVDSVRFASGVVRASYADAEGTIGFLSAQYRAFLNRRVTGGHLRIDGRQHRGPAASYGG